MNLVENVLKYRFDIIPKVLYAKFQDIQWFTSLYKDHIMTFNGGKEDDNGKKSVEDFIVQFRKLINSMSVHGYDSKYPLLISRNMNLVNGSHRLSISYLFGITPSVTTLNNDHHTVYDYRFFKHRNSKNPIVKHGMELEYMDFCALYASKIFKKSLVVCIFPRAEGDIQKTLQILSSHGTVFYHKTFSLSYTGLVNLTYELYRGEGWIGGFYPNTPSKADVCRGNNPLHSILWIPNNGTNVVQVKERIRELYHVGKHSVHIPDTHHESIRIAKTVFHDKSLQYINKITLPLNNHNRALLQKYHTLVNNSSHDVDDFCVDSSFILAMYGLREAKDLDYLCSIPNQSFNHDHIDNHFSQLPYYSKPLRELIYDPSNFFYFAGLKFLTLENLYAMKKTRNEEKDRVDCALILPLIE